MDYRRPAATPDRVIHKEIDDIPTLASCEQFSTQKQTKNTAGEFFDLSTKKWTTYYLTFPQKQTTIHKEHDYNSQRNRRQTLDLFNIDQVVPSTSCSPRQIVDPTPVHSLKDRRPDPGHKHTSGRLSHPVSQNCLYKRNSAERTTDAKNLPIATAPSSPKRLAAITTPMCNSEQLVPFSQIRLPFAHSLNASRTPWLSFNPRSLKCFSKRSRRTGSILTETVTRSDRYSCNVPGVCGLWYFCTFSVIRAAVPLMLAISGTN